MRWTAPALLGALLLSYGAAARAVELPPTCAVDPLAPDDTTSIAELRARVEATAESEPQATVRLMCATIPRVARECGEDSVELAWWLGALAMPLIAYMDKHAEAEPLLATAGGVLERRLGPDAEELADIHVAHAWIDFRQGRLTESKSAWEDALRIRERHPGPNGVELQKALVGLAQTQISLRDFAGARETLERAQAILERNKDTISEAAAAIENALTNVALREEDYVAARRHAETQIDIETRMQNRASQLVPAYVMLGQILERLDEFEESERAVREAVRLSESKEGPLQRHHLAALTRLAILLSDRGRPEEALDIAQRALDEADATLEADAPRLVGVLQILAETQRAAGRLPEALHTYERAAAIVERHHDDVEQHTLVAFYRGLGGLWFALGDVARTEAALTGALEVAGQDPTLSVERAGVLQALAEAGVDPARSRPWLVEALGLLRARLPGGHPVILRVINDLCALEIAADPTAVPDCDDAAARIESAGDIGPSVRQAVHETQSRLAEARRDAPRAHALAVQALAAAAALGTPEPLLRAQFRLAQLLAARGQHELAIFFGKQAIAQIERMRGRFVGEDRRLGRGFLEDKAAVYRAVADWLMEAGRLDEGLGVLRLLKTEELYDFALRDAAWGPEDRQVELTADEQGLWQRYAAALDADAATGAEVERLSRLREAGRISVKERERLESLLEGQRTSEASRATRIGAFIGEGAAAPPRPVGSVLAGRTGLLEQDLRRFGADSALALYVLTDDHLRILVATRLGRVEMQVPLDARVLQRDIGSLLDAIGRRADVSAAAQALYATIARPVDEAAHRAGAKRLILELDGALRYVPFAALSDGRQQLVDKYAIEIYAPAGARPATDASHAERVGAMSVRGLGVTRAVAGYRPLPAVADELRSVVRGPIVGLDSETPGDGALPGAGFADAAFTEARLRGLLDGPRDFSVLHLGTHFSLRPGNALRSFLVLGDGAKLTLDSLRSLDFSGIELFTLSACQTALGGATTADGREVEGLSAIVQRRGAKRVVASLWPVEDVSTAQLMGTLYRGIAAKGADAPRALQRAQLALRTFDRDGRRPYEHPYYWAGFVLSGRE